MKDKKIIISILLISVIATVVGYYAGYNEGLNILADEELCSNFGGKVVWVSGNGKTFTYCDKKTEVPTKTISILEEKRKCDEWNGEILYSFYGSKLTNKDEEIYLYSVKTLSCAKTHTEGNKEITEKLFDYTF